MEFLEKEGNYEVDRLYVGRHPQKHQVDLEISDGHRQAYTGFFFLTAIWLPHDQLWAIIEEAASPDVNHLHFAYSSQKSLAAS